MVGRNKLSQHVNDDTFIPRWIILFVGSMDSGYIGIIEMYNFTFAWTIVTRAGAEQITKWCS